jgi:4-aminobutyrate aminotransferase-like enzyme
LDSATRQGYIEADRKYICRTTPFPKDMVVQESEGCYVYDVNGKQYLDLLAGIAVNNVGHRNPEVVQAVIEQVQKSMHLMVYGKYVLLQQRLRGDRGRPEDGPQVHRAKQDHLL